MRKLLALLLFALPLFGATGDPVWVGVADSISLVELDDDANSPSAGDFIVVETGDATVDYLTPNGGTDVTADLEEEGQVNATAVTGNAVDDQLIVGSGASTAAYATLSDCPSGGVSYTASTNTFGCTAVGGSQIQDFEAPVEVTISTGAISPSCSANNICRLHIDTESDAASDDLTSVTCTAGAVFVVSAEDDARSVVIQAASATDFTLDDADDRAILECDATNSVEFIARHNGG